MKLGLFSQFSWYTWMYTLVKNGMAKGICTIILCLFDVIDYLLNLHDAITHKVEKCASEKEGCVGDYKMDTDINQLLDMNFNYVQKPKLYETEHVSFTVAVAQSQLMEDLSEEVMSFDRVISNEGDGFDYNNGKFICPVPGVYVFFFSSTKRGEKSIVSLIKDGCHVDAISYGNKRDDNNGDQVSHMAVLQLKKSDQVWLTCSKDVDIKKKHFKYATFSGFLLYEQ